MMRPELQQRIQETLNNFIGVGNIGMSIDEIEYLISLDILSFFEISTTITGNEVLVTVGDQTRYGDSSYVSFKIGGLNV